MVAVVAVLAVAAGGTYGAKALVAHGRTREPKAAGPPRAETTRVKRMDLSNAETLPGTLGHGTPTTIKGTGGGSVTRLPEPGSTISRGTPLYWVDDRPVMVFLGDTPIFRKLAEPGVTGRDVTVLDENLRALGYDTGTPANAGQPRTTGSTGNTGGSAGGVPAESGTKLTSALLAAVKRWQRDTGQQQTGTLGPGQVVVLPGTVRVDALKAQLGDPVAAPLLTVASTKKSIGVKVDASDADPIHKGDTVAITLPDTKEVPGKVASVGTTVQGGAGQDGQDAGVGTAATLQVTVVPADSDDVAGLDTASVQVTFTTETRRQVLAVPVGALLALSEGGYALQRPDGRLLGVRTGLFAKGMVEVSGDGITAGERVVTAS
ncbi:peptidoglycan-binding protein [Streptomyces sulfonofaciens]|uniref:Peptidoglycan-binding protein n=1 Tax=Streptomyces sulfonofaciens TaxID=68272 RepID=A0A919GJ48_9ACTN|nr:hypothetical protein [Streptomyces sulfonofaciens]GHH85079.1 peptidoglycan-binding protein [Streptomyces sulfonofaciens]